MRIRKIRVVNRPDRQGSFFPPGGYSASIPGVAESFLPGSGRQDAALYGRRDARRHGVAVSGCAHCPAPVPLPSPPLLSYLLRVPTLLEKIEANAALRLSLPPGQTPAQELPRFKNFLKVETHRLKILHRAGASGREICRARAAVLDLMLRALWDAARGTLSAQAQKEFPPLSLVAIGGYGRGELNPHSDIDFMFLHTGQVVAGTKAHPYLSRIMDGILYPLWDIGIKFGHAVRTVADCVQAANSTSDPKSMETKTSLIESRLVAGDSKLFEKFQKSVLAKCVEGYEEQYIAARIEDQNARRTKFGNSATMQ